MKITIVTTMRNEGSHLLEWIAYHQGLGVTDFLVYTNDCEDGVEALLNRLPRVTHVPLEAGDKPPQWRALKAAWDHPLVQNSDWLACIDCDEFISLNRSLNDLPHLISTVDCDAIFLPWRLFGSSGEIDQSDRLTIERFQWAAPKDMLYPPLSSYFKTLFRRAGPFRQFGVHRPKHKSPDRHRVPKIVDGSGVAISQVLAGDDGKIMNWGNSIANELVQLNHYSVRSVSDFMIKRSRGLPNHRSKSIDLTYWVERNFNSSQIKMRPEVIEKTKEIISSFRQLPGVTECETACRNWATQRLANLLKQPDELALYGRIILAKTSDVPDQDRALQLIRAYQVAHG